MSLTFYKNVAVIDELKQKEKPSIRDIIRFDRLTRNKIYERYFFHDFANLGWFDMLIETDIFERVATPTRKGKTIVFPPWWPGIYLEKVADKIPDKVFNVIIRIETNNINAHAHCAKAILNMPSEFLQEKSKEVLTLFDKWLSYDYPSYVHDLVVDLLRKYIDSESYDGACRFFNILSKPKKKGKYGMELRIGSYYYNEIIEKYLPILIQMRPFMILDIIETRFREVLDCDSNFSKTTSEFWRATIEDTDQTWGHSVKDLLFVVLRNTLHKIAQIAPKKAKKTTKHYLEDRYSIFERLAIHIVRVSNFDDLAIEILTNKENLHNSEIYHEFVFLMKDKFGALNVEQKKQFITWILEGPTKDNEEGFEKYKRFWQARWLLLLKDYIEGDEDLIDFRDLIDEYKDQFSKIEHPDLLSYTTTFVGPRSPLKKEQLERMTPAEFVDWAKSKFPPPYDPFGGSPEGVSRMLEGFIKQSPQSYAQNAEKFLDKNLWPTYLSGLIRGLDNAVKDGKIFDLVPVLRFIESSFEYQSEPEAKYDYFEVGKYSWFRRTIASFIETLVRKDELPLSSEFMDRTQQVLIELIEKDADPTEESEKKYGSDADNMGYVTYCMNSNRGGAMIALMQHALRRARMRPKEEKEKEKGKGPFPSGERMDLYKEFFTKRLKLEPSPSVQSSYGQFLSYLFYLDQEWVKQMKQQDKLFPKSEEKNKFWEAHWQGYVGFNNFYNQLYELLKDEYNKAVEKLLDKKDREKQYDHYDERLTRHLITAFWRKLENIGKEGDILNAFFKNAPAELRGRAIWFLADAIENLKPTKDSGEWQRLKNLWNDRIKKAKDEELVEFAGWLKYCPEDLDDIAHLIEPIIPYLHIGYHGEKVLNFINGQIEVKIENVSHSLCLLNKLLKIEKPDRPTYLRNDIRELIREILTKAYKYKDKPDIKKEINEAVNRLGMMGHYDLRNLLIE